MKEVKNTIYTKTNSHDLAPKFIQIKYNEVFKIIDYLFTKYIVSNFKYLRYLERIDTMKENELDLLAEELDVDFYDFGLKIEEKRKLCRIAFETQRIKGTHKAINNILEVFYDKGEILEFVDYNGNPGNFKIQIQGTANEKALTTILERVEYVKKHSQHLEGIRFKNFLKINLYGYMHLMQHTRNKILPGTPSLNIGGIKLEGITGSFSFVTQKRRAK